MTQPLSDPLLRKHGFTKIQFIGLIVGLCGFILPYAVHFESLSPAGHRMLSIFFLAITFWLTEVVPMFATAVLIIMLEILLLSNKAIFGIPPSAVLDASGQSVAFKPVAYSTFLSALADPVIILFLGGFFLADGATKYGLDRSLARVMLRPFGSKPSMIMMGFMLITALFSMFMSNTATTATFMAVVLPVVASLPVNDRFRSALVLCIPVAANLGGIGTPIGTPPNAIALGALAKSTPDGNSPIGFMHWMLGAVPFMLVFLTIAYFTLLHLFKTETKHIEVKMEGKFDTSWKAITFYATFALTVILWMTEALHGLNSNVIGFVPVVILSCTRVMGVGDLKNIEWHVLWLVAGGISLGVGIGATGMGEWFVGLFDWSTMTPFMLVAMLTLSALICGTFISHSATTNLLVPIALSLTASGVVSLSSTAAAVFVALGASLAMMLPISTPPNAIAYASGQVNTRDMAVVGMVIGLASWAVFILAGPWFWKLVGIIPS